MKKAILFLMCLGILSALSVEQIQADIGHSLECSSKTIVKQANDHADAITLQCLQPMFYLGSTSEQTVFLSDNRTDGHDVLTIWGYCRHAVDYGSRRNIAFNSTILQKPKLMNKACIRWPNSKARICIK